MQTLLDKIIFFISNMLIICWVMGVTVATVVTLVQVIGEHPEYTNSNLAIALIVLGVTFGGLLVVPWALFDVKRQFLLSDNGIFPVLIKLIKEKLKLNKGEG